MNRRLAAWAALALGVVRLAGAQAARLSLEAATAPPWAFSAATARCPEGLAGELRLYGLNRDGSTKLLARARPDFETRLQLRYYSGGLLEGLRLEATGPDGGTLSAELALPPPDPSDPPGSLLASLNFPYRQTPLGPAPASADLGGDNPDKAASLAAGILFAAGRKPARVLPLAAWACLALVLSALASRKRPSVARTGWAAVVLAPVAALAVFLAAYGGNGAQVFSLALPPENRPFAATATVEARDGYARVTWTEGAADPGSPSLRYLAVRSPQAALVPLAALDGYGRVRFRSEPTLELGSDGVWRFAPCPYIDAWGLYGP